MNVYYLEDLLASMERLVKCLYQIEKVIDDNKPNNYQVICPILKKNKILNEETWFEAQEKLIEHVDYLDENDLSYRIESDFLEKYLLGKIHFYEKYLANIFLCIRKNDPLESILFFVSNLLFDLGNLLVRYYAINVELEVQLLTKLDKDDRDIKLARIIDDIKNSLSYRDNRTDFVTKKYLLQRRKRLNVIFNRSNDQSLKSLSAGFTLLSEMIRASKELQGKRASIGEKEKDRTIILASFIQKYIAKDESGYGVSETGKSIGELDIKIENSFGEVISLCEAFNLKRSFNKNVITSHLQKISGYNANGIDLIFIVVFCELSDFSSSWRKYFEYIGTVHIDSHLFLRKQELNGIAPARMKICEAVYRLNGNTINFYHLFLDMK